MVIAAKRFSMLACRNVNILNLCYILTDMRMLIPPASTHSYTHACVVAHSAGSPWSLISGMRWSCLWGKAGELVILFLATWPGLMHLKRWDLCLIGAEDSHEFCPIILHNLFLIVQLMAFDIHFNIQSVRKGGLLLQKSKNSLINRIVFRVHRSYKILERNFRNNLDRWLRQKRRTWMNKRVIGGVPSELYSYVH